MIRSMPLRRIGGRWLFERLAVRRTMTTDSSTGKNKMPIILHPYSQSLPKRGYEWCSRCGIRCHGFQKRIGEHHACLDLPRAIPFLRSGICGGAKLYYRQQMNYMLLMTATIFVLFPVLGVHCDDDDEEEEMETKTTAESVDCDEVACNEKWIRN